VATELGELTRSVLDYKLATDGLPASIAAAQAIKDQRASDLAMLYVIDNYDIFPASESDRRHQWLTANIGNVIRQHGGTIAKEAPDEVAPEKDAPKDGASNDETLEEKGPEEKEGDVNQALARNLAKFLADRTAELAKAKSAALEIADTSIRARAIISLAGHYRNLDPQTASELMNTALLLIEEDRIAQRSVWNRCLSLLKQYYLVPVLAILGLMGTVFLGIFKEVATHYSTKSLVRLLKDEDLAKKFGTNVKTVLEQSRLWVPPSARE
jgi:hypothetical protein